MVHYPKCFNMWRTKTLSEKNDGAYDGNENSKNHKIIVICQRVVIPVTDGLGNGLMKEI